jgi:outer membrane protein TolC
MNNLELIFALITFLTIYWKLNNKNITFKKRKYFQSFVLTVSWGFTATNFSTPLTKKKPRRKSARLNMSCG